MSLAFDFSYDEVEPKRLIRLDFPCVELYEIDVYLEAGVEPHYGFALLQDLHYWQSPGDGRDGFTLCTTALEVTFYANEIRATVR